MSFKALGADSVATLKQLLKESISMQRTIYSYTTTGEAVTFTIPGYDATDFLDIYINGLYATETDDYTVSANGVVTLVNDLDAGTVITFSHSKISVGG